MKNYLWNIMVGVDQLFNAIMGGNPRETICSRIAKRIKQKKAFLIERLFCKLLDMIDKNHCERSIQDE
jgi:hypothetical protein